MAGQRISGRTWSIILAVTGISRALSYEFRPPQPDSALTLIEGALPYPVWAGLLTVSSLAVIVGISRRNDWATFAGHCLLLGCYATFACSVAVSAVLYDRPWSGLMLLVVVSILHTERIFTVGRALGEQ